MVLKGSRSMLLRGWYGERTISVESRSGAGVVNNLNFLVGDISIKVCLRSIHTASDSSCPVLAG